MNAEESARVDDERLAGGLLEPCSGFPGEWLVEGNGGVWRVYTDRSCNPISARLTGRPAFATFTRKGKKRRFHKPRGSADFGIDD